MEEKPVDLVIAVPTLVGSLLSFLATSIALTFHIIFPPKRHFRHALIINLLISDLMNSLNLSISGIVIMSKGFTTSGPSHEPACIANAWITQFSVQAVDFNILIISITVLLTVTNRRIESETTSLRTTVLLCVAAWIPSLITTNIGLGLDAYGYVSGNWCWIIPTRLGLRYALTHGWRVVIFLTTIIIYTIVYIRLRRVFGRTRMSNLSSSVRNFSAGRSQNRSGLEGQEGLIAKPTAVYELDCRGKQPPHKLSIGAGGASSDENDTSLSEIETGRAVPWNSSSGNTMGSADGNQAFSHMPPSPNIKKVLLLNGYPIAYIILWIPGMANRLAESIGYSPRWLSALQASTQFVGLANALTYGISEQMRRRIWREWEFRRGFSRTGE